MDFQVNNESESKQTQTLYDCMLFLSCEIFMGSGNDSTEALYCLQTLSLLFVILSFYVNTGQYSKLYCHWSNIILYVITGFWAFLWFVCFCFLANQWQRTTPDELPLNQGADAARAAITFSFFSIFTWVNEKMEMNTHFTVIL